MSENFKIPEMEIKQFELANGLRVLLNRDNAVPVVAIAVYYDVGSRNEPKGRTGFAHLFEHMMFQGSENVPKAGHFQYIMKAGGTMNGTTSSERTNYYETLPANQLPLGLWLESDRMRTLAVTQENLDNQREAVKEEKRLRYDNQPYGKIFDEICEMIFVNFANAHSTIGSMDDLDAATVDDVRQFFKTYYAPNNAVLSISGSFDYEVAEKLVRDYFENIPRNQQPPQVDVSEPVNVACEYRKIKDPLAPFPAFLMGWKIPQRQTLENKALYLAGKLLYDGDSSRLYQKLVKGEKSVIQLFGITDERRGPSCILIGAIPKPEKDISEIRNTIMREIKDLSENGPQPSEMQKLHNQLLNDTVRMRQSSMARAQEIAEFELYDGDGNLANRELDDLLAISPEDIRNAAAKFLDTENRALLDVEPGS